MITDLFRVENGALALNKYKLLLRRYRTLDKNAYTDETVYVGDEGLYEWEVNRVPKHQLLEIISKEGLDNSEYAWMEGITLKTDNYSKEINDIAACGSMEAYQASLPEATDDFKIDTDYRLSKLELGI